MRKGIVLVLAISLTFSVLNRIHFAADKPAKDTASEVHLVSIYEGFEQTGKKIHGPKALVHVDRPGKHVTLVLTSHTGATWHVTASEGTEIEKVILGGYAQQAAEGIPESTKIVKMWKGETDTPLPYSYKSEGTPFRRLVKQTYALTNTELTSFHGKYRPEPQSPFLIDGVQKNPELSAKYPQPTPLKELPEEARDVTFMAHHYVAGRYPHELSASFGEHTLTGPVEKKLKPLPDRVKRITYDPDGRTYYGISDHSVVQIDMETKAVKPLDLGLDVPRLSWPCEITYDTKRKRVILGSSGGGGYLYAYSTENQKWSVIAKRPGPLDAFVYSPEDDFIYGVLLEYSSQGNVPALAKVNAEGAIVKKIPLGPPIHTGSLSGGPGVSTTQLAIAGKYIAILASPGGLGHNTLDATAIYLVDPATKKVWLTSKTPMEN